jgi:large subunit ribosomal protein L24
MAALRVHVKRDDVVTVISGAHKGKSGKVLTVDRERGRVTVEGINKRRRAVRRSADNPQGGIVETECPIHASNVMLTEQYDARQKRREQAAAKA